MEGDAFSGVPALEPEARYWSSTTHAFSPDDAWIVRPSDGRTIGHAKSSGVLVWPVRGGE
jgi:hypothetical protein